MQFALLTVVVTYNYYIICVNLRAMQVLHCIYIKTPIKTKEISDAISIAFT